MDFCNKIYQTVQYDTWATITNQKLKLYNNEKYLPLKITVSKDTVNYYQVSVCQIVPVAENFVARRQCFSVLHLVSYVGTSINLKNKIFRCIRKIAKKQLFTSACLCVCHMELFVSHWRDFL